MGMPPRRVSRLSFCSKEAFHRRKYLLNNLSRFQGQLVLFQESMCVVMLCFILRTKCVYRSEENLHEMHIPLKHSSTLQDPRTSKFPPLRRSRTQVRVDASRYDKTILERD